MNKKEFPRNEAGVPLGGIGAGKIEFCADGRFTNITTNNNLDAPIFGETARTPPMQRIKEGADGSILENAYRRKILNAAEGVPGAWLAFHTPLDGARVLKTISRPVFATLKPEDIEYEGRFPRAQVRYPNLRGISLKLQALSSFDVDDRSPGYQHSSMPLGIFIFDIENTHTEKLPVSLAFSWQNLNGIGGYPATPINEPDPTPPQYRKDPSGPGLWFGHDPHSSADRRVLGDYSLRAWSPDPQAIYSYHAGWDPSRDGYDVWELFKRDGMLANLDGDSVGGALGVQLQLSPGEKSRVVFALAWNMPDLLAAELRWDHLVRPSSAPPEPTTPDRINYGHAYSQWFEDSWETAGFGLREHEAIERRVNAWHQALDKSSLPPRIALALSNDLFPLVSSTWYTRDGRYAMNEAPTDMNGCFGTLDQRAPGHAAVAASFAGLNKSELNLFARDQIRSEDDPRRFAMHWNTLNGGHDFPLDRAGAILHDVGWDHLEGGRTGDAKWSSAHWPELTSLFVIQTYQCALWSGDQEWLDELYPQFQAAMRFQERLDQDEDGVADMWGPGSCTYDTELYPYFGASAYVTGLYLAALRIVEKLAIERGDDEFATYAQKRFSKAQRVLEDELWDEQLGYYISWRDLNAGVWKDDFAHAEKSRNCHVSQLAGAWWADMLALGDLVDPQRRRRALQAIHQRNVQPLAGCPADESTPDGKTMQSMVAVSMVYFNAHAILAGLPDLGWEAVEKAYHARYDVDGCPWDATLQWSGEGNLHAQWGRWYMSHPACWYLPLALTGLRLDRLNNRLTLMPNWPSSWGENFKMPVFLPGISAEVTSQRGGAGSFAELRLIRDCDPALVLDEVSVRLPVIPKVKAARARRTNGECLSVVVEADGLIRILDEIRLSKAGDGFKVIFSE